jgi:PTS system mannitol-specific IIC component
MGLQRDGRTVLRNKIKKAGIDSVTVDEQVDRQTSTDDCRPRDHAQDLTDRAKAAVADALHVSVENFMNSPKYDERS